MESQRDPSEESTSGTASAWMSSTAAKRVAERHAAKVALDGRGGKGDSARSGNDAHLYCGDDSALGILVELVGKEATELSPDKYGAAEWWLLLEPLGA